MFISEGLFSVNMAMVQLILLALLVTTINVRAKAIGAHDVQDSDKGRIQSYCDICLQ